MMFGVESKWMIILWPEARSNCGPSLFNGPVREAPAIIVSSAACRSAIGDSDIVRPSMAAVSEMSGGLFMVACLARLIGDGDVGDKARFADLLPGKWRALLEPGPRRRRAPQCLPAWILQRPAQRFMVVIPGEVIAGV